SVRRFSGELVGEAQRRFIRTLWNTYSFFVTYANIDKFDPRTTPGVSEFSERAELDRWVISELQKLIVDVIDAMEGYNPTDAGRRIQDFVEDLSNWYVRRSRRRFWKSESDADKLSAYATLYECLVTLAKLLAPLTPFIAEEMYRNLVALHDPNAPESVHLTQFPIADLTKVDEQLAQDTRLAMTVASLGRAKRSEAGIKVRQPLDEVIVGARSRGEKESLERMRSQILDELNVKKLRVDVIISTPTATATAQAPPPSVTVELNTNIDQKLADEGMARELVHRLQTMRKQAGFDIADYIYTYYQGGESLKPVIEKHADYIKQETLSRDLIAGIPRDAYTESLRIAGEEITLGVKRQG
ncbi:MAG: class I tRNA ligase family protein, partial [Dehalococcoidia bacterium]|nr:class I tRNA ligase family protein [Dehalococcoidia bacterium]